MKQCKRLPDLLAKEIQTAWLDLVSSLPASDHLAVICQKLRTKFLKRHSNCIENDLFCFERDPLPELNFMLNDEDSSNPVLAFDPFWDETIEKVNCREDCLYLLLRVEYELEKVIFELKFLEDVKRKEEQKNQKRYKKLMSVAQELVYTENNYLNALEILINVFYKPLKARVDSSFPIIDLESLNIIFFNVGTLCRKHRPFYEKLNSVVSQEQHTSGCALSSLLTDLTTTSEDYLNYVENYSKAIETLRECRRKRPMFVDYIDSIALHLPPNVHRYRVQDILIMPVQRIPRYFMLLETYAAVMGPTDPDYPAVQTAARRCRNLTTLINDRKRYADSIEHVYILAQKVVSAEEPIEIPGRRCLLENEVVEVTHGKRRWRVCVLFTDSIFLFQKKYESERRKDALQFLWKVNLNEIFSIDPVQRPVDNNILMYIVSKLKKIEGDIDNICKKSKKRLLAELSAKRQRVKNKIDLYSYEHGVCLTSYGKRQRVFTVLFESKDFAMTWAQRVSIAKGEAAGQTTRLPPLPNRRKWHETFPSNRVRLDCAPAKSHFRASGALKLKVIGVSLEWLQEGTAVTLRCDVEESPKASFTSTKSILVTVGCSGRSKDSEAGHTFKAHLKQCQSFKLIAAGARSQKKYGECTLPLIKLNSSSQNFVLPLQSDQGDFVGFVSVVASLKPR
ncbi:breakpoint cluster region protein-like isoform X2 [Zophobas morio]|uniref:breakpoint cluster region protein-like isoform X2 n=1 Tax=Zophobas morio TaxID=2755281 RepID=UPI003082BC9F